MDSEATHHLTNNMQNLAKGKFYLGSQLLLVGNGQGLEITHIGSTCLSTFLGKQLNIFNVSCLPKITKNLINLSKLLLDNHIIIEFVSNLCFIKDKMQGTLLAQGNAEDGLFKLLSQDEYVFGSKISVLNLSSMLFVFPNKQVVHFLQELNNQTSVSSNLIILDSQNYVSLLASKGESMQLLHNRFGHPSKYVLQTIMKSLPLHSTDSQSLEFCDACQCGKLHQFHFPVTDIKSKYPLQLLYADLWGPTSVPSMDGYKYYISFVDDFTRYCWIFPLTLKSEALDTFKHFKLLVEKQFSLSIKTLQIDIGGEFIAFNSFIQQEGIHFRYSCPHTHHQNSVVEKKHRHIVET